MARDTQARGHEGAPSEGQAPIGTGHQKRHNVGAGNHPMTRKWHERGPEAQRKRTPRQAPQPTPRKGIPRRRDQRRPAPSEHGRTPGDPHPQQRRGKSRTPYGSLQRTCTSHRKPHGEWRAHLHGGNGLHPQKKPQGTPPRGAPPHTHRQTTTPAATRATTQAPEEDDGTTTAPRARDRDPQGSRDQGTGPQGGQPHGHLRNPPARAARPGPHSMDRASHPHLTAPPSHQPAPHRPALRTTTQARLTSTDPPRHNTRQHSTPHRSAPHCNAQ